MNLDFNLAQLVSPTWTSDNSLTSNTPPGKTKTVADHAGSPAPLNLRSLNDAGLLLQTENVVREERALLTSVLRHLDEIHRRRLFSALGYKSLFDFAVRHLGYPEDQAYRRISAMKLLNEIPEVEEKISSGELSLSHIGLAQAHFRQEKKIHKAEMSSEQKLLVLDQIAKKPVREAERITLSLSSTPEKTKPDRVTAISENAIEMKFTASADVSKKIEQLKGWLAHKYPNLSLGELFEKLCDLGMEEWNPAKTATSRKRRVNSTKKERDSASPILPASKAQTRREVFRNAKNQCENCGSTYFLEVDHIQPQALGGNSLNSNLRLLCRSCNQRAAIEKVGFVRMNSFINH